MTFFIRRFGLLAVLVLLAACNAYSTQKPTPAPKGTVVPAATVGPLNTLDIPELGLSLQSPSAWPAPALREGNAVISPTGTADTSASAGPFLFLIADAAKLAGRSSITLRSDISDPSTQLNTLLDALNRDGPRFSKAEPYAGTRYPAAVVTGFEKDNQMMIVLLHAGENRWIYVGVQSKELYFSYYNETVFAPAIKSITVKSR